MFTTRPELVGDFGMVASTHWLASATGMSVLERGGNAADAAVAAALVLQVVEPHLNGPGGDVPILLWNDADQRVSVICGQGVAPAAAAVSELRGLGLDLVPGTGHLPTVVPGAFGAWMLLLERWGTWSVRDVLEPAIRLAGDGHPLLGRVSAAIGTMQEHFEAHWPSSARIWLPGGAVPKPGSRFRNPVLAETYARIAAEAEAAGPAREVQIGAARDCWYRGFVAEKIDAFMRVPVMDTSGDAHLGWLTADDLARWEPTIEEPVSFDYHGVTVCKTGPWGQGPVFLQQLALLSGFDLDAMGPGSADWVHTIIEAGKLAFADREAWYGDPRFTDVPLGELLSPSYNDDRRALVTDQASWQLRPGSPGGQAPHLPRYPDALDIDLGQAGAGEPTILASGATKGDTCHLDIVDRNGMMISATPSGGWMQGSPAVPGLGFCISTRGQMFWAEDGLPNSLRPGARPRTTLTPSLALRDGQPWLAFGTPGGDFQDQWTLHFFLNVIHGKQNLQRAIDEPAFHSIHMPNSFYPRDTHLGQMLMEGRFAPEVVAELRRRGHGITLVDDWSLGSVSAVAREDGWFKAAANARGAQGYAAGR
jgi:gamma-glutamyltranspeptidase/glutathione hydrolase